MTTAALVDMPGLSVPDAGQAVDADHLVGSRQAYSRMIGALFPLGFLSYGTGFALVSSVIATPDFLATMPMPRRLPDRRTAGPDCPPLFTGPPFYTRGARARKPNIQGTR
jgi:hypothetical protein